MGGNNHKAMATMTAAATMRGGRWCRCNNVTISHYEVNIHKWQQRLRWQTRGSSGSCICGREACCPWATARAVKTTATRVMEKARGSRVTRVRVMRVMMETSPREEGDDGHNNQLGTKAAAMARTMVAMTARAITTAARAMATGAKRATAMMATMATKATMAAMVTMAVMVMTATMTPNIEDKNKNQAATAARVITTVARVTVIGAKRTMAMMATTATTATMAMMAMMAMAMMVAMAKMATITPNSDDAASGDEGNKDTKR
jgi:hypothetical protein